MASIFGRATVMTKTNKSGGALAKGDVVVIDTSNDNAVTTTTTGATTAQVGVVVEENGIANNSSGRVAFGGHVALVNVNASVTRGNYGGTHTVAKQAASLGASRVAGAFCQFTTGGTTPEADLFTQPDVASASGNVATDTIWDAAGDLVQGTGANTGAKLTAGSTGQFLGSNGAAAANSWKYPPGYELDYVQITSPVNLTATSEATANTIITGSSVAYDGSTVVVVEAYVPYLTQATSGATTVLALYEDGSSVGLLMQQTGPSATGYSGNLRMGGIKPEFRRTPSAGSHTYSLRGYTSTGTAVAGAGAGGSGAIVPAFLRITKV